MNKVLRVEWTEKRRTEEPFLIIAEKSSEGWSFSQRSSWELGWYPVPETDDRRRSARIRLAESLLLTQRTAASKNGEHRTQQPHVEPSLQSEAA
jgi:hypothetical protein